MSEENGVDYIEYLKTVKPKNKLVPVVSVEWLKKWCKKEAFDLYNGNISKGFKKKPRFFVHTKDLLVAVEKEAKK